MDLKYLILDYVKFNAWANQRLVKWLLSNPAAAMTQEVDSSFNTIEKTVEHIVLGQEIYISAVNNVPFQKKQFEDAPALFHYLNQQSATFITDVEQLSLEALQSKRLIKNRVANDEFSVFALVQHFINHSTYHRGQVVTMGHQLGLNKAPSTDYFWYRLGKG